MLIKKRVKKCSSSALVKASEAVSKNQKKAKLAAKDLRSARDAVAKARLALRAAGNNGSSLVRSFERAKLRADKAAAKVAVAKAKVRTAKAKARAIEFSESEKLRKRVEQVKRKEDLEKAVKAFVTRWNRKRDKEEAAKAAKRAKKIALKMRLVSDKLAKSEDRNAITVAENAKSAARRASKKHAKRT